MLFIGMSKSRDYIKRLTKEERAELAGKVDSTLEYLYQIGARFRTPSRRLALKLERETKGRVKAVDFDNELK